jgi:PIN domain nuclease of toxin-antitoxin system
MAEYVLDTHACLFALAEPKKLGRAALRALERADARGETVWLPAAAAAEIVMLKELGRTELGLPALERAFEQTCWRFLPLALDQIDEFAALAAIRDPFDRLIVAAARCSAAKLISRDDKLRELGLVDVVWS